MSSVPPTRLRALNDHVLRTDGAFVLYWMVAARRTRFNYGLQHAVERARELDRPLVVLEALRCDYRWASERFHRFVIEGMADNASRFRAAGIRYYPYVEPTVGASRGLLEELATRACEVVTDDFPAFMLPRMIEAGARRVSVRMTAVDSNGVLPMDAADRAFTTAHSFRRFLQKELREHLVEFPKADPLARANLPGPGRLPASVVRRWPATSMKHLTAPESLLRCLPVNHSISGTQTRGGPRAARAILRSFIARIERYSEERNRVDTPVTSGLSAYLHFGHLSSHEILAAVLDDGDWSIDRLSESTSGSRTGWWGLSPGSEAFVDQLVTWRELGFNMCRRRADHDRYDSLPGWALRTLADHAGDRREPLYRPAEFDAAETHDELWNAAQRQLRRDGIIHNYLRMLWGKKILEWSASPQAALDIMIELNNRYALDGRDPNSYSGIFWVLGRFDRAWGPERPVFGKVRFMASRNTARKLNVTGYLERYGRRDRGNQGIRRDTLF